MAVCNGLIMVLSAQKNQWRFIPKQKESILYDELVKLETWKTSSGNYSFYRVCYTKQKAYAHVQRIKKGGEIFSGPKLYIIKNDQTDKISATIWKPDHLPDLDFTCHEMTGNALLVVHCTLDGIRDTFMGFYKKSINAIVRSDFVKEDDFVYWHVLSEEQDKILSDLYA